MAQQYKGWESFKAQPIESKLKYFNHPSSNRLFDIIFAQQFDKPFLQQLFDIANQIRKIAKSQHGSMFLQQLLADKRAMLFFVQPSTRTFMSFLNACHILGMKTSEIRDTATSSEVKGESPEDSIRTFSSYVDLIITRHPDEGFAQKASWVLNSYANRSIPIINGGSGKDQHPTQALLDIYTLSRAFSELGGIDNKRITMIGDLKRGRTVRSLCRLLALYHNVHINFVSPASYCMREDILKFLDQKGVSYHISESLDGCLEDTDAIYATRLQDEHNEKNESSPDLSNYNITAKHLDIIKPSCIIMHPFPRRNEIHTDVDQDPRAHYWKQARNGMWIRAALMLYLFEREHAVKEYVL